MTKRIFLPTQSAEDWRALLADPDKHWREGYSARTAAEHWEISSGLPTEIESVFERAELGSCELLAAFPEWKTPLPGGRRESQTDILALISTARGLFVAGVEAKVAEPFGPTVSEWLAGASMGKLERLDFLQRKLGLYGDVSGLRYQLLHRTAAALIEAERFSAAGAAMIVQSFSPVSAWKDDFEAFANALGLESGVPHTLSNGRLLLLSWAQGPNAIG
ncbi:MULTISPECIES: DUF6946 family protein [Henriciella]|jgi:hypothetical protein|uniref:DUF6946 family protein n=1 Tax=Henriciella TaxID=453849 RepID=UPI0035130BC7